MNFKEILTANGWVYNRKCSCGGVYREYYHKNRREIAIYPNRNNFSLNSYIYPLTQLEEKLKVYDI